MSKGNPMPTKYYSYKIEFALRGAAHAHGVLWMDWDSFTALPKSKVNNIKEAFHKIKNDVKLTSQEKESVCEFADSFISCSLKDPKTEDIVRSVNTHHHTKTCRKYGDNNCRFYFPRFPSLKTIVSVPVNVSNIDEKNHEQSMKDCTELLSKVKTVLEDEEKMKGICSINQDEINIFKELMKRDQKITDLLKSSGKTKKSSIVIDDMDILLNVFEKESECTSITILKE